MNASHNLISPQLPTSQLSAFSPSLDCAAKVVDIVPAVMQHIYTEVRQQQSSYLSIPQLRALAFLQNNSCSSLASLAEYLGVTSASASTMVERLVQKEFITRTEHPTLRRQVVLCLTITGEEHLQQVRQSTSDRLEEKLNYLSTDLLQKLLDGLDELSQVFM